MACRKRDGCNQSGPCEACEFYVEPRKKSDPADLAQHMTKGNKKHREYDYTEIEDRINLKLDTLKDRLQHLKSDELEAVESSIDCAVKLINLFRSRNRPSEQPQMDKPPDLANITPGRRSIPRKPSEPARIDEPPTPANIGPCNFLPACVHQRKDDKVIWCGNVGHEYYLKACSKRCTAADPVFLSAQHLREPRKATGGQTEGFDGSTGTRPLSEPQTGRATTIENIVDALDFEHLTKVAAILGVSYNFASWHGDEFHDKEDALRVAVAEAMEKL